MPAFRKTSRRRLRPSASRFSSNQHSARDSDATARIRAIGLSVRVWFRILLAIALLLVAFDLLQQPARIIELHAYAGLLRLIGFRGIAAIKTSSVLITPAHHGAIWIGLLPSCSALAPVLTVGCLAAMLPHNPGNPGKAVLAYITAALAIVICNLLRIDLSILAGLLFGRSVIVLFHNSVGTVFGFAYTLGGFALMLYLLLPDLGPLPDPPGATQRGQGTQVPAAVANSPSLRAPQ